METRKPIVGYKGRKYRLLWAGQTKFGPRAHLSFVDGSKDFWVAAGLVELAPERAPARPVTEPIRLRFEAMPGVEVHRTVPAPAPEAPADFHAAIRPAPGGPVPGTEEGAWMDWVKRLA